MQTGEYHKYLGRHLSGALSERGPTEIKHRLQAGWYKFHQYRWQLTNPNVSVKLRLKLFDSVVSPCVLFGLGALPIHQQCQEKVDITQRKMLRRIVGWRRIPEEEWSVTMSRMKMRVNAALDQWPIKPWSFCSKASRWKHACRVKMTEPTKWVSLACKWVPGYVFDLWYDCVPHRHVGGQFLKWDDSLAKFSQSILHCKWHDTACNGVWNCYNDCYMRFYA